MASPPASRYVIYVGFLAILAVFSILLRNEGFATPGNLVNIVQQTTPVTVMAVGTVFVLTAGEIDLSIGSTVAVSALLAALVLRSWPWPAGVAVGLGAGAAIGALNGAMVAYGRLPSFLVTLGTMGVFAGVGRRLTDLDPFRSRTTRSTPSSDQAPRSASLRWSSGRSPRLRSAISSSAKRGSARMSTRSATAPTRRARAASRSCACGSRSC